MKSYVRPLVTSFSGNRKGTGVKGLCIHRRAKVVKALSGPGKLQVAHVVSGSRTYIIILHRVYLSDQDGSPIKGCSRGKHDLAMLKEG